MASASGARLSLHRIPDLWEDPDGSMSMVLRSSRQGDVRTARLLDRWQNYTSLSDWEAITRPLSLQKIPVKRVLLQDYAASGPEPEMDDAFFLKAFRSTREDGAPTSHQWSNQVPVNLPIMPVSGEEAHGGPCAPLRPSPMAVRPAATESTISEGNSSLEPVPPAAVQMPRLRVASAGSDEASMGARFVSTHSDLDQADPAETVTSRPPGASQVILDDASLSSRRRQCEPRTVGIQDLAEESVGVTICNVRERDNGAPRGVHGDQRIGARRRVSDKDKAYIHRGPQRTRNAVSRRRLDELLELPKSRVDVKLQHPSRSFNVVPLQNLRVE